MIGRFDRFLSLFLFLGKFIGVCNVTEALYLLYLMETHNKVSEKGQRVIAILDPLELSLFILISVLTREVLLNTLQYSFLETLFY